LDAVVYQYRCQFTRFCALAGALNFPEDIIIPGEKGFVWGVVGMQLGIEGGIPVITKYLKMNLHGVHYLGGAGTVSLSAIDIAK